MWRRRFAKIAGFIAVKNVLPDMIANLVGRDLGFPDSTKIMHKRWDTLWRDEAYDDEDMSFTPARPRTSQGLMLIKIYFARYERNMLSTLCWQMPLLQSDLATVHGYLITIRAPA